MLLWSTLLCLFSATLVVSQFAKPGILADNDPNTTLQPMKGNFQNQGSSDDLHVIRGLLRSRQSSCPTGYAECTNPAGRCCPIDSSCCPIDGCCDAGFYCYSTGCCPTGAIGCEGNSCCTADQSCCSGGGCCAAGFYCTTVDGQRGCCPNGETCTSTDTPQCQDPTYVVCTEEDFCCPPGYTCFRDSAGDPKCSLGGNTSIPPTLTSSSKGSPTASLPSFSSSISKSSSTTSLPPRSSSSTSSPLPTPSTNSNSNTNSGVTSSAISIVVDALLASFAGVGAFIFLF